MKVAVMQPYLFPYIGYFQLISAVDQFVIYDDVNYIKQGWINRNRIIVNGKEHLFTLELRGASSFKLINEIGVGENKKKIRTTIEQAYKKSPFYKDGFALISEILGNSESNLALFLENSIRKIAAWLELRSHVLVSSQLVKNSELKGQDKVLAICKALDAKHYINPIGGIALYQKERFAEEGVQLSFLKTDSIVYKQYRNEFFSSLSIVDVMMFNGFEKTKELLNRYVLV